MRFRLPGADLLTRLFNAAAMCVLLVQVTCHRFLRELIRGTMGRFRELCEFRFLIYGELNAHSFRLWSSPTGVKTRLNTQ